MKHKYVILMFMVMLLVSCVAGPVFSAEIPVDQIVIVANADVPATSFTPDEVKAVFVGEIGKIEKVRLGVTILDKCDVHESFLKNYIKKTSSQFLSSWKKLVFSGKANMPKEFKTEEELVKYVAKTSGAVGYVHVKTSQDSSVMTGKVKVIPIKK